MLKHARLSRSGSSRKRRHGAILLELVLTIPFSLILIFIVVDVGRYVLVSAALHDAVATAARAGARQGVIGGVAGGGRLTIAPCDGSTGDETDLVYRVFCDAAINIPGARLTGFQIKSPGGDFCTVDDTFVTVAAAADFDFLTDVVQRGLGKLLGLKMLGLETLFRDKVNEASERSMEGTIYTVGTARCEVAR